MTNISKIKKQRLNHILTADAIECMLDGAMTCMEIAEHTGLHRLTVGRLQLALHRRGAAHICGWGPDVMGRLVQPLYKIGRGKDCPRPKPLTMAQRNERRRAKAQADRITAALTGNARRVEA